MPSTILVPTMGASLIGVFISLFLYGVTSLQTYFYFDKYWHSDSRGLKSTVAILWVLETIHAALACAFIFRLLILNFGDFAALEVTTVSDDVTHGILAATISVVHAFYIWRLWIFTRSYVLTGIVTIFAGCHFAFEMVVMALLFKFPDFKDFTHATPWFTAAMAMAVAADTIISVAMALILKGKRSGIKGTNTVVNRLITYIISTGLLTSVIDIIILSASLAMPENLIYLCFLNFINNLYSNSMLAMLNARQSLRSMNADTAMDSLPSTVNRSGRVRGDGSTLVVFKGDESHVEVTKSSETRFV
ncbi:hypothetical protein DFH09DRAFT_1150720 [Mycena vulgaris]|nr:hypothetical protein DFH09DRAFT_1150720 [Mycena vulgaris]